MGEFEGRDHMEQDVYRCPHCGVEIANVQEKVMLHKTFCRGSYENFSDGGILKKSTMDHIFELLKIDLKDFPWGVIVRKGRDEETTITYGKSKIYWPVLGVGVLAALGLIMLEPDPYLKITCWVVIGLSLVYFVCNVIYSLFSRWVLTLKGGRGSFFCGVGRFGRTVRFEYNSDSVVGAVTPEDFGRSLIRTLWYLPEIITTIPMFVICSLAANILETHFVEKEGIALTTNGRRYTFGGSIPRSDVIKYMAACLLREIAKET